uniref:Transposase n=1 Tax=Ascaris lumbricoides TaxID=6252 RepID=A0A0M3HUU4_ASCLU
MFFYVPKRSNMIYSQAFRNEQFSPAVALFGAAGLIRTTAGIQPSSEVRKVSRIASDSRRLSRHSSARSAVTRKHLMFTDQHLISSIYIYCR